MRVTRHLSQSRRWQALIRQRLMCVGALPLTPRVQEGIDDGIVKCRHDGALVLLWGGTARRMAGLGNVRGRRTCGGTPVERALFFVCSPPLWQLLLLLLGLTAGLALHFALLQLLGNLPRRRVGRLGNCRLCRWPLALSAGVLFLLAALRFAPGAALVGAILLSSALLLAVVDAATLRLPDVVTQPLLWLGLLFNLGATFVPLSDAVCGAVIGYLMLWGVNGGYRLVYRRHGLGAGDFKLLAALGAWLGWRALPPLLLFWNGG
ncbi:prepilin peptidase [Sodalis sp.]|uniref:prepilin peptidase n=1 Tax=Sodalis sp. (in: enterobacteria) TaxID=1898979 RepID=UPI003872EFAF